MKTLFAIFLSLLPIAAFAQEPTLLSLYGIGGNGPDQVGTFVTGTADGGFITQIGTNSISGSGNIDSFCDDDIERQNFLKYNGSGSILEWHKCYEAGGDSAFLYAFPTNENGLMLGGEFISGAGWGMLICKEDALCNMLWQKSYSHGNGVSLTAMVATDDGGYIMSGQCYYTDSNFTVHHGSFMNPDIAVLKVDSLGNKLWSTVIGGTDIEDVFSIAAAPGGGCYIVGTTQSTDYDCTGNHGEQDVYLARLDKNGNLLWHKDLGGSGDDGFYYFGWAIADGKGGVLIATGSNSIDGDVHHHIGDYDYWVADIDSNNNLVWDNCYGSIKPEFATSICKATDGSLWITGESSLQSGQVDTSYGNGDAWIVHTDSVGNFINAKVLGGSQTDLGTMVYPITGGGVILGGNYSWGDGAFSSLHYYGTSQSFNGFLATFSPENQTSVRQISANGGVYISPNPARSALNITFASALPSGVNVVIVNIFGQQVYCNTSMNKSLQVDVSEWPAGMYFVKIMDENTLINATKIEIQ